MGSGSTQDRGMPVSRESAVTHVSYEELDYKLRSLAEQIQMREKVTAVWPKHESDYVSASLLAHFLNVPLRLDGITYSHYSGPGVEVSLVKKNSWTEHYNDNTKYFIDEVMVDEQNNFMRVTLPWQKP